MSKQVTFAAEITDDQVRQLAAQIEQNAKGEMWTIRAALFLMARSFDQLQFTDIDDAEAFMELLESVGDSIKRRHDETALLECAQARLFVLMQHYAEGGQ